MDDLIRRRDAIDAIHCNITVTGRQNAELVAATIGAFADRIKALPSAQPEPKTGKWIYDGDCYICNQCKSAFSWWADSQTSHYCPNCGADMRGEENG